MPHMTPTIHRPTAPRTMPRCAHVTRLATLLVLAMTATGGVLASARGLGAQRTTDATRTTAPRSTIDTTISVSAGALVDLTLIGGVVRVVGSARSTVHLRAVSQRGELRLQSSASRVILEVDEPDGNYRRRRRSRDDDGDDTPATRYDVQVPVGTRVLVHTTSGDVSVTAVRGEIEAQSVSGDVIVTDGVRRVQVESVSGDVRAEDVEGDVRATSVSGDVALENVRGAIVAESVSGDIRLISVRSASAEAETVSGDVTYLGTFEPAGRYDFQSHSGDVDLTIPAGTNASVEVETFSGSVDSDFPLTLGPGQSLRGERGGRITFALGSGGPRVSAVTFSGDVKLTRGTGTSRR